MDEDYDLFDEDKHNPEIGFAAWIWLTEPEHVAARTEPVVAIVAALLEILSDPGRDVHQKCASLRRALRLLNAFVGGKDASRG